MKMTMMVVIVVMPMFMRDLCMYVRMAMLFRNRKKSAKTHYYECNTEGQGQATSEQNDTHTVWHKRTAKAIEGTKGDVPCVLPF